MTTICPPAIVIGGKENALSVARSLGRRGIRVLSLAGPGKPIQHSRYSEPIALGSGESCAEGWARFLLGQASEPLRGAVLLACDDEAIEIVVRHREALSRKFLLEERVEEPSLRVLDKLDTYREAAAAGVPTPRFWHLKTEVELDLHAEEFTFPMVIKPLLTHRFERAFGKKYVGVEDYEQLQAEFARVTELGFDVVLMEFVPGGDDKLCSYYTYLGENGEAELHFTKRIIRRYPTHQGGGCAHITDWNPEAAEFGLRFMQAVGLRGLGNVEFKRDDRDGELKLIECNARFTAANCLVTASGFDLAAFVYSRLTGGAPVPMKSYRRGLRLWAPIRDFMAFLELREDGVLSFPRWIASVLHRQTFPYFSWSDPLPSIVIFRRGIADLLRSVPRRLGDMLGRLREGPA
ncbi:MAG: carboxylate--amine ligase [Myxococcales bacterium]|nr:carboxylate--amine ligase [Myxococcales bacterium]